MLLHRFPAFETRSVRAAREDKTIFRQVESFAPLGDPARFHLSIHSVTLGAVRLSAVRTTGHRVRPVDEDNISLLVPWRGLLGTDDGRRAAQVRLGQATLPRPGRRTTIIPGDYLGVVVQTPLDLLARHAARNPEDAWNPDPDWPEQPDAALQRYVRFLVADLDSPDTLLTQARAAESAAGLFTDLVLDAFRARSSEARTSPPDAGSRQVREAEEAMRARLHEPLSIVALAGELGLSTRALQLAFRRHRGTTPRKFLAARRLEAAHARLATARPGETVAKVALDVGVSHLGRFAGSYRARFGELPSTTLERARQRG